MPAAARNRSAQSAGEPRDEGEVEEEELGVALGLGGAGLVELLRNTVTAAPARPELEIRARQRPLCLVRIA